MRQDLRGDGGKHVPGGIRTPGGGAPDGPLEADRGVAVTITAGFALFLIFNTFTLWGGFPVGSLFNLAMHDVLCYWSIAMLAGMIATFLVGIFLARRALPTRLLGIGGIAAAVLGVAGCLLLTETFHGSLAALISAASLLGICNGLFYLLWEQAMTALPEQVTFKVVLIATAFFPLTYFCMRLLGTISIPMGVVVVIASGALLVVSLHHPGAAAHDTRRTDTTASSNTRISDGSTTHGHTGPTADPDYRAALHIMRGSLFCVGAIGFMVAITRSLALTLIPDYNLVGSYALVGVVVSAALLLVIWFVLKRPFDLPTFYKIVFPVAITILLTMSFVPAAWSNLISAFFYLLFTMISSLIMLSGIQVGRATDTHPVFCFGVLALACYLMVGIGTVLGILQLTGSDVNQTTILLVALLCVYLLSMVAVYISNKRFDGSLAGDPLRTGEAGAADPVIGQVTVEPGTGSTAEGGDGTRLEPETPISSSVVFQPLDTAQALIAQRCTVLAARYQLSARETEIMGLLIRGYDVRRIARELFISENTVRYHSKNIYAKMDIHNKQELLALYEED